MRPALPLSVQLLLTFVGLLVGITIVLTTVAYTSLLHNLDADARRTVSTATRTREQSLTQLFQLRQQRAEAFLVSLQSLCAEAVDSSRLAWVGDCVRPMVDDFRKGEGALSALLTYRTRVLRRSGVRLAPVAPLPGGGGAAHPPNERKTPNKLASSVPRDHQPEAGVAPSAILQVSLAKATENHISR